MQSPGERGPGQIAADLALVEPGVQAHVDPLVARPEPGDEVERPPQLAAHRAGQVVTAVAVPARPAEDGNPLAVAVAEVGERLAPAEVLGKSVRVDRGVDEPLRRSDLDPRRILPDPRQVRFRPPADLCHAGLGRLRQPPGPQRLPREAIEQRGNDVIRPIVPVRTRQAARLAHLARDVPHALDPFERPLDDPARGDLAPAPRRAARPIRTSLDGPHHNILAHGRPGPAGRPRRDPRRRHLQAGRSGGQAPRASPGRQLALPKTSDHGVLAAEVAFPPRQGVVRAIQRTFAGR